MADAETPVETANRLIAYHAPISRALTQERTSLESALIPVTAYIVVACAETYLRYPEMMRAHRRGDAGRGDRSAGAPSRAARSTPATCGRSPTSSCSAGRSWRWSTRQGDDPARTATVLDFWERAALAYRGDGTRQAWDTGTSRIYDDATVAALLERSGADRRRRAPSRR